MTVSCGLRDTGYELQVNVINLINYLKVLLK